MSPAMRTNGCSAPDAVWVSRSLLFQAFDALPCQLRRLLAEAQTDIDPILVSKALAAHDADTVAQAVVQLDARKIAGAL